MGFIEIFNSHYAVGVYNPEKKCVEVTWHGNQTFEEYKALFQALLEFQRNSGLEVIGYISDIRDQGVVNPNNRKWFEQVALPQAVSQGLKWAAVVLMEIHSSVITLTLYSRWQMFMGSRSNFSTQRMRHTNGVNP